MRLDLAPHWLRARAKRDEHSGCWIWHGSSDQAGYGRAWVSDRLQYAHRAAWEWVNGPIPPSRVLHHTCSRRACVHPAHLILMERGPHIAKHAKDWPKATPEERREANREGQNAWKARRLFEDGCRVCLEPARPGYRVCEQHRQRQNEIKRLARRGLKAMPLPARVRRVRVEPPPRLRLPLAPRPPMRDRCITTYRRA